MKRNSVFKLNVILAIGLILILSGFFLLMNFSERFFETFPVFSVISIVLGSAVLYSSFTFYKRSFFFFVGLCLFFVGAFALFTSSRLCPFSFSQSWPISAIICALSLLITSFFRYRRPRSSYVYPSIAIGFLGVVFLLFSADVVKLSFSAFMGKWWPVFLIVLGLLLVILFFIQQATDLFPYAQDEDSLGDILE